jgi:V/A-type H+-transporting ATPase subunit I
MIVRMAKVRIMGPRIRLEEAIRVVQDAGVLHLAAPPERPQLQSFQMPPGDARRHRQLTSILVDIDASLVQLGGTSPPAGSGECSTADLARWARMARRVRQRTSALAARSAALDEELALLARYRGFFATFESLLRARGGAQGASAFHIVLRSDQAAVLPQLRAALGQLLETAFEFFSERLPGGEIMVLILVPGSAASRVEHLLAQAQVHEIPVPAGYGATLVEAMPRMRQRESEIPGERAALAAARADLARRHHPELVRARAAIRDRLLQLDALPLSGVTSHAFVLEGWLPAVAESGLAGAIDRAFAGEVVVELIGREQWRAESAPVVLQNPRLFRPFEMLIRMVPLPRYGSLDPTPFVAVFFPMFFGLIMGDVGYGLVLAGVALVLHRRSRPGSTLKSVSEVAGACAVFAIIFGVLFGEYFGDLGRRWLGLKPAWMDREQAIVPFLILSVALGLVHVVLGLVLGALSSARTDRRLAIGRGLSAVMILLIVTAILAAMKIFPHALLSPAVIVLLIAFPVLVVLEGVIAPVELLSTLGHVLSYARIMALGTASVMLAIVANRMAGAMGSVVVGVMFALLFHLVNFALGLFTPTIHALRLHYVEFFGTFYSPGGVRYNPLGHWRPNTGPT